MRVTSRLLLFVAVVLFVAVSPGWATLPVTGGSHYGGSSSGMTFFDDCLAGTTSASCESIISNGTLTVNGQMDPLFLFVEGTGQQFGGVAGTSMEFNVIDLGSLLPNTSFSLPSSLFGTGTSVFSCNYVSSPFNTIDNNQNTIVQLINSNNDPIGNFCTAGLTSAPDISLNGNFQTGPNYNVSDLFLISPLVVSAPEPGGLALLSFGLLALCGLASILKIRTA